MSDVSSRQAARDAGGATHWTGAAARHGPPPASDGPRLNRPLPGPGPVRLDRGVPGPPAAISPGAAWLARGPVWRAADDRRCKAYSSWPGHAPGETNLGCSGSEAPYGPV